MVQHVAPHLNTLWQSRNEGFSQATGKATSWSYNVLFVREGEGQIPLYTYMSRKGLRAILSHS